MTNLSSDVFMTDIISQRDIKQLVEAFYNKAISDQEIGYFFTKVTRIDLASHLPIICSFWESVLLGNTQYKRNPMLKHIELNRKEPMLKSHFERWFVLWEETVNEKFEGEKAKEAIKRASMIKELMFFKVSEENKKG